MSFRSPWRHRWYVWAVNAGRRVLRPFGQGEEAFIAWLARRQNRRVSRHLATTPVRRALLIMPRCVKKTGCHVDVQHGLDECLSCMGCPLGDVAQVCRRHDVEALVAFRSHIAFEMARTLKPDVIIASACHDRMVKALRSVPEVPALLAPLAGMERMCVNATLDLTWLEQQVAAAAAGRAVSDGPGAAPLPVGNPIPSVQAP